MQKINHTKLNKSNADIWGVLYKAIELKNWALVEQNIKRLYALHKYIFELLEFQDAENASLKNHLAVNQKTLNEFEKEWLITIAKNHNVYEEVRQRIEKI
jgi:hypothetical protein